MNILNEQINSVFSHTFSFEADNVSVSIVNIMLKHSTCSHSHFLTERIQLVDIVLL